MPAEAQIKTPKSIFFTLEKAVPEGREKARNPGDKEACVNSHRRLQNQFFFYFGESCSRGSRKG